MVNKKYQSSACNNQMKFEECELAILRDAVDSYEMESKKKNLNNPEVIKIIQILEKYLRKKKLVCYGGTAINKRM